MRVTNSPASRKRRGRMLTAAKGFRLKRSKLYRYASDAVDHGRQYAYRDRRVKKRTFRYLWQIRISGTIPATLADFKIDPPSLLAVPVKNETPVRVEMTWHPQ